MTDRLEEMGRLSPGHGPLSGGFWDGRAERYAAAVEWAGTDTDPFLRRLRRVTGESGTAIDVGAGTGRFAVPLASTGAQVTAVDPSVAMLAILERDALQSGVGVTTVLATWEEAEVPVADVAFSSFVLPLVADLPPFLLKLEAAARGHVLLYLGAFSDDAVLDPLWRHFHGSPRAPGASYLDALAVLEELGITPEVKMVEIPVRRRFATVAEAVEHYRDGLLLDDTPEVRRELERLLETWLLGRNGALRPPLRSAPAAIVHWRPGRRGP